MGVMVTAIVATFHPRVFENNALVGSGLIQLVVTSRIFIHGSQFLADLVFQDIRVASLDLLLAKYMFKFNLLRFGSVKFSYLKQRSGSNACLGYDSTGVQGC